MIKYEDCDERNNIPDFNGMLAMQNSKFSSRKSHRKDFGLSLDESKNGNAVSTRKKGINGRSNGRFVDFDFSVVDEDEEEVIMKEAEEMKSDRRGRRGGKRSDGEIDGDRDSEKEEGRVGEGEVGRGSGRGRGRGREVGQGRGREIISAIRKKEVPLVLRLPTLKCRASSNKSEDNIIPISGVRSADVTDFDLIDTTSNIRGRSTSRSTVPISAVHGTTATTTSAAAVVPVIALTGRKRDRDRAERALQKQKANIEAALDAAANEIEGKAREKQKLKSILLPGRVKAKLTHDIDLEVTAASTDEVQKRGKKVKLTAPEKVDIIAEVEDEEDTFKSQARRRGSHRIQSSNPIYSSYSSSSSSSTSSSSYSSSTTSSSSSFSSSSSSTTYPPSSLLPFSESILRDDPLTAAIYQTFSCDIIDRRTGDMKTSFEAPKESEAGAECEESNSYAGFSTIFSMAGLDCFRISTDHGKSGKDNE